MIDYLSQIEFQKFAEGYVGRLRLEWLALTGRAFTNREKETLSSALADFFRLYREKTPGRLILETFWAEDR
jgi:hypothetical protein